MIKQKIFQIALLLVSVADLSATTNAISHIPPQPSVDKQIVVAIDAEGILEARVIQSTNAGVGISLMTLKQGQYVAELGLRGLPLFKYRIQAKDRAGNFIESQDYIVEILPEQGESGQGVAALDAEFAANLSRIKQLENSLTSLRSASVEVLAKGKAAEIERAKVLASKRSEDLIRVLDQVAQKEEIAPPSSENSRGVDPRVIRRELYSEVEGLFKDGAM